MVHRPLQVVGLGTNLDEHLAEVPLPARTGQVAVTALAGPVTPGPRRVDIARTSGGAGLPELQHQFDAGLGYPVADRGDGNFILPSCNRVSGSSYWWRCLVERLSVMVPVAPTFGDQVRVRGLVRRAAWLR